MAKNFDTTHLALAQLQRALTATPGFRLVPSPAEEEAADNLAPGETVAFCLDIGHHRYLLEMTRVYT